MKKDKLNIAVVGFGHRGRNLTGCILMKQKDVELVSLSDVYKERADEVADLIEKEGKKRPFVSADYKEALSIGNIDAVLVSSSWESHIEIAIYALRKHIAVAMEVGRAYSLEQLWALVRAEEETGTPFMLMENCCFDKEELLATHLTRLGLFGEIVHCEGAYGHDLRKEISDGHITKHYRLRNYEHGNCDNYPTHEIGPIAKILDINRGNRFVSLVAMSSKSAGLHEYVNQHKDIYPELSDTHWNQGDVVDTIISCANGETVHIKLETTLPRFYNREFAVRGTKGFFEGATNLVYVDNDEKECFSTHESYEKYINSGKNYEKYLPRFWREITKEQLEAGHGGMDYFEWRSFIDHLKNDEEQVIDVYDAASWMAIAVLSEESIQKGGAPVSFPDFTNGKWMSRARLDVIDFDKD